MARFLIVEDNAELADLIVATARSRGHEASAALTGEQARALLTGDRFHAAIVDLLLPDIRGAELLWLLKDVAVPAIAVSGVYRGDRFAREAVQVHGAKAFFEKPFVMAEVMEAAEKACGVVASAPAPAGGDALEELAGLAAVDDDDGMIIDVVGDGGAEEPKGVVLPFADREAVWAQAQPTGEPPKHAAQVRWPDAGAITEGSVPRLLTAFYQARHTGELKLRQGNAVKVVYFEHGKPVYAASNLLSERFGRFCVRRGVLSESDLTVVAQLAQEQKLRTGAAMRQLGLLTPEARKRLLEDQVKEIIWSTFSWANGDYSFSARRPARTDILTLDLLPGDLVLEGIGRSLPLVALRGRMPQQRKLFPASDPPYGLHELNLSAQQARLVVYCDGTKSVEDLLALADLSERETLAALVAFEAMGLVEPRDDQKRRERVSFGL